MLRRNEVQAVEGASSKWRDNAGIRQRAQRLVPVADYRSESADPAKENKCLLTLEVLQAR